MHAAWKLLLGQGKLLIDRREELSPERLTEKGYKISDVRKGMSIVMYSWILGAIFFSLVTGVVFNAFLTTYLHTDDFTFGIITSACLLTGVFQILGSYIAERTGRVKRDFIVAYSIYRFLWLGLAAVPLFMMNFPKATRLTFVGLILCISYAFSYIGGPAWFLWVSDFTPKNILGKFTGMRSRIGLITMVAASFTASRLIDIYGGAGWLYAILFTIAGILGTIEILFYIFIREVPRPIEATAPSLVELLITPWKNRQFRSFSFYTFVSWISYMMMGNYATRYCLLPTSEHGLGMSVEYTNFTLSIVVTLVMAFTAPFWGGAIDRIGAKSILATSSLSQIIFPVTWLFMRPGIAWILPFYAAIIGLTWPGIDQVIIYMQMKGFPEARRSAYVASFGIIFSLSCALGNFLGGFVAAFWQKFMHVIPFLPPGTTHYHLLFMTTLLIRLAAFVFILPRIPLPRKGGHGTVAKIIASDATAFIPNTLKLKRQPTDPSAE